MDNAGLYRSGRFGSDLRTRKIDPEQHFPVGPVRAVSAANRHSEQRTRSATSGHWFHRGAQCQSPRRYIEPVGGMGGDARKDIGKPRLRIDAVDLYRSTGDASGFIPWRSTGHHKLRVLRVRTDLLSNLTN